jgi:hypothetical protein
MARRFESFDEHHCSKVARLAAPASELSSSELRLIRPAGSFDQLRETDSSTRDFLSRPIVSVSPGITKLAPVIG